MTTQLDASVQSSPTTAHFERIRKMMFVAGQGTPSQPTVPDEPTALLRARIILEEALEAVDALGVTASFIPGMTNSPVLELKKNIRLEFDHEPDLVAIADACADISVVTIGTLVTCGIPDNGLLELVDNNNMTKFKDGVLKDANGKFLKPDGWEPPNIEQFLKTVVPLE